MGRPTLLAVGICLLVGLVASCDNFDKAKFHLAYRAGQLDTVIFYEEHGQLPTTQDLNPEQAYERYVVNFDKTMQEMETNK